MRRIVVGLVAVAIVSVFLLFLRQGMPAAALSPESRFESYLRAAAGGEADRGWHYLGNWTRERSYENDLAQYARDAAAADWSAFRWSVEPVGWTDDGFAHVQARLLSGAASVPAFLIERRIVHGVCVDAAATAIGVFMDVRPFGDGGFGGGGLTGSQMHCNSFFIGEAAYEE